jgi:hypothetical protein
MLGRRIGDMLDLKDIRRIMWHRYPATHSEVSAMYYAMADELEQLYNQTGISDGMPRMREEAGMAQADGEKGEG